VRLVFRRLHERFKALKGPTLQQRADDVATSAPNPPAPSGWIVVVEQAPGDVWWSRRLLLPTGSRCPAGEWRRSWWARSRRVARGLLTREKRIPVVAGPSGIVHRNPEPRGAGRRRRAGTIVVSPDAETAARSRHDARPSTRRPVRCRGACREPPFTLDGELVTGGGQPRRARRRRAGDRHGADGVGLFPSTALSGTALPRRGRVVRGAACTDGAAAGSPSRSGSRRRRRQARAVSCRSPSSPTPRSTAGRAPAARVSAAGCGRSLPRSSGSRRSRTSASWFRCDRWRRTSARDRAAFRRHAETFPGAKRLPFGR